MCCDVWKVIEALFVNLKENKAKYPEVMKMLPRAITVRENFRKNEIRQQFCGGKSHLREQSLQQTKVQVK